MSLVDKVAMRLEKVGMRRQRLVWNARARTLGGKCPVCHTSGQRRQAYGRLFLECQDASCGFIWCHDSSERKANLGMGLTGSWGGVERGGERDDFMVRLLNNLDRPRPKVMIFGAGTTLVFRVLHDEGFDIEGVDVSPEVVDYRSAEFPGRFGHADDLQRRNDAFDIITACEVFEHFHDPNRWVATLAQNLAPDGILCGSTNFYPGSGPIEDTQKVGYMSLDGHVAYWSERALARCCRRLDMEIVLFELECPGSVKPDLMWGSLFPNKRLFFASRDEAVIRALKTLKASTPILPCDTSDYPVQAYRAATPPV